VEKIVPELSKISNIVLFFIDIHAYIKLHDDLHQCLTGLARTKYIEVNKGYKP
jgi:hypothetical protein